MNAQMACPLCGLPASISPRAVEDVADVRCKRCGDFAVSPGHIPFDLNQIPAFLHDKGVRNVAVAAALLRAYLSIYTRECAESGARPELVNLFDLPALERLAETYAYTPVAVKPDKLLRLLARRTAYPGASASFNPQVDYPAIHAERPTEFVYYLKALVRDQLIETSAFTETSAVVRDPEQISPDANYAATITLAGWAKLGATGSASRSAFVAMSFEPSLDAAFSQGIAPAISDAGYEPLRVDKVHHNEKICDRIVVEIRRSRFVVADVTKQRQGVYFEAGFAMALGLPVIWSCHENEIDNVHFDTRQYNHVVWKDPAQLRSQLHVRIIATIGSAR